MSAEQAKFSVWSACLDGQSCSSVLSGGQRTGLVCSRALWLSIIHYASLLSTLPPAKVSSTELGILKMLPRLLERGRESAYERLKRSTTICAEGHSWLYDNLSFKQRKRAWHGSGTVLKVLFQNNV